MKRKVEVLCILLLCALSFSCGNKSSLYHQIVSLDALADSAADTALVQLRSMENQVMAQSENIIRRWQLACIKAEDKSDVPFSSDSLIKILVPYFDLHGSVAEQIEAHYYWGRTYYELHDSPRAVVGFRRALELYDQNAFKAHRIAANACSQLSDLFWRQFDYNNALEFALKGEKIARENGFCDPIYIMDVASCYLRNNNQDSTTHYYNMAYRKIVEDNSVRQYGVCVAEIMSFFVSIRDQAKAKKCQLMLESLEPSDRPVVYTLANGSYYEAFGPQDSAIYYNQRHLEKAGNLYGRKDASRALMSIYGERGDYDKALRYAKIYAEAEDSIREMLKIEQTRNANNEFQYRRDMEAEVANERRAARAERWLMAVVGGSMILLLGGLLLHVDRRRRLMQRLLEQERAIARQRTELEAARSRMEDLKRELKAKDVARETVMKMMLTAEAGHSCPDVVDLFRKAARGQSAVGDDDWLRLAVAVEELHPGFADTMIERWPDIGPDSQHIAYLLQIGMEPGDIMRVMNMPKSSLYRKVKQTRAILFGE